MQIVPHPPRVALIARTRIQMHALEILLQQRGLIWTHEDHNTTNKLIPLCGIKGTDGALLAEFAGRGCYNSFYGENGAGMGRKTNLAYIQNILKSGHGSVLEHITFTFHIWGCSRGFTHELVRHRVGTAISQSSTRFRDEGRFGRWVVPPILRRLMFDGKVKGEHRADRALMERLIGAVLTTSLAGYLGLIDIVGRILESLSPDIPPLARRKTARGAARSLLPIGIESPITWSANVRTLRHFLEQRASRHAELEIREIAMIIYDILIQEEPVLFADYEVVSLLDGTRALQVKPGYRKV